jgi:hypothetical protein
MVDTPMGAIPVGFTFKTDGATVTGTSLGPDGAGVPIKNGKVDGNKISFSVDLDFGGMAITLRNYVGRRRPTRSPSLATSWASVRVHRHERSRASGRPRVVVGDRRAHTRRCAP